MPIHAKWTDDSKTIIHTIFEDNWTVDEFAQVLDDITAMLNEVVHTVYAVADGEDAGGLPRNTNLLPHFRRLFSLRLAHIAIVPSSGLTRVVLNAFLKLNANWNSKITFTETAAEGFALVESIRENEGISD